MSEAEKYIDAVANGKLTIFQKMALCVNEIKRGSQVEIECKMGLWSVIGPIDSVYFDSLHYFKQYMDDGEYHKILGGKSPAEILSEKLNNKQPDQ